MELESVSTANPLGGKPLLNPRDQNDGRKKASTPTKQEEKMNPTVEMLVRPEQAWAMLGIKKTKFYELAKKDAEFPKLIKKGRSTFLYLSEVQAYLKNTTEEKKQ